MSDEQNKEQQPESQADENLNADDGTSKENVPDKGQENKNEEYYKSQTEALKKEIAEKEERLKKAEHTIVDLKRKKADEDIEDEPIDNDKLEGLEKKFETRLQQIQKQNVEERARELAVSMTKGSQEAELVLLTFKNKIVPSGNLQKDMEDAYAMVNGRRTQEELQELARAQKAKQMAGTASGASQQNYTPPAKQADYNQPTRDFIKKEGIQLDPKTGKAISPAKQKYEKKMKEQFPDIDFAYRE